jgi:acyl dehydratase
MRDPIDVVDLAVERGKIREFARATGARDPVHVAAEAALATATHTVAAGHLRDQAALLAALGLARERVVVGSAEWQYERPIVAGDLLRGTRAVVSDEHKRGGALRVVTLETTWTDAAGAVVVRQREVLIERGAA